MTTYEVAGVQVSTPEDLFDLPSQALVKTYNELTGKKTTKFSSKSAGVRQVWAALQERGTVERADVEIERIQVAEPQAPAKPRKARKKTGRRTRFNAPARPPIVPHRPDQGYKRARAIELLLKGATLEQVMSACDWAERDAKDGIWLLNRKLGYGLREGDDRIIHLTVR